MDNVRYILTCLPAVIHYEGIAFTFSIIHSVTELKICYGIEYIDTESKHYAEYKANKRWYNPFTQRHCDFIFLHEGIQSDRQLEQAIINCFKYLEQRKLL